MQIKDYDDKMAMILDFYDQTVEILSMVNDGIHGFHYLYGFDIFSGEISDEIKKTYIFDFEEKINKRKKQLLIELGRVGEYAIKYVLLLKQMNDYPNQTFEEFKLKAMYSLADKGVANTYINQYHMNPDTVATIRLAKEQHQLQPLHDYDYLFTMLKVLHPDIVNNMHKVLELRIKRHIIATDSNLPTELKTHYSRFPDKIVLGLTDLTEEELQQYKDEFEKIIQESGDVFTRLRYLENNPNNKQYDLETTLNIIEYLVDYIKLVHEMNHDNLDTDITIAYRKECVINEKIHEISRSVPRKDYYDHCQAKLVEEKQRVEELFNIERIANNCNLQDAVFFRSSLSPKEIKELFNQNYTDDDLYALICNNITEELIRYFKSNDIYSIPNIIRIIKNNELSLEKIKNLELSKDQIHLLIWLNIDTIRALKKDTGVYEYIINNKGVLNSFFKNYMPTRNDYELFKSIIELDEVESNPSILNLLDYDQLRILNQLNIDKPTNSEIILNIKENINEYKNKNIFNKIPIMLSSSNIKKVYQLIIDNGFDDSMIESLDSTIFCISYETVLKIINLMKEKNIKFIEHENINPAFYAIFENIRISESIGINRNIPLPLQHLRVNDYKIEFNNYTMEEPIDLNIDLKVRK